MGWLHDLPRIVGGGAPLRPLVIARVIVYLAAAGILQWIADAPRTQAAAVVCLAAAAVQPLLIPAANRVDQVVAQTVFDAAAVLVVTAIAPQLWFAALVVVLAGGLLVTATSLPDVHLLVSGALVAGLLLIGSAAGSLGSDVVVLIAAAVLAVAVRGTVAARRHRAQAQRRLADAFGAARAIVQSIDVATGRTLELTGDVEDVTGWPAARWRTIDWAEVAHPDDVLQLAQQLDHLDQSATLDTVGRMYGADGRLRWLHLTGRVETDHRGRPVLQAMLADVTAIHRISEELYEQARRDRITGLPNRQRLEEDLDQRAVHAEPFALLVADIRQFKAINDTLGHHIGDLVLSMMGTRLAQSDTDDVTQRTVYRLSADQFAVVLDGVDTDGAAAVAQQIAHECRRPYYVGRVALGAPVAVGVALSAPNVAPSLILRQADVALHAAKSKNSQVETYHDDMQRFTLENLVLSAAVEHGLDHGEFTLHFQPQVDLTTGSITGCEGLVRWQHPERGLLPPTEFLETIRVSASFDRFTLAMVRQAARAAARAVAVATQPIGFAVNIELTSLLTPGFTELLLNELGAHRLGHHHVVLEVTETDVADHLASGTPIDTLDELTRLRAGGFRIAIDDFGTGSSSLARLERLPADEIKIDRAFVKTVGTSTRAELLLAAIVQLGRNLGLRVVAEGIEELTQLDFLVGAGCGTGQGWLFGQAMPFDDLAGVLATRYPVTRSTAPPPATRGEPAVVTELFPRRTHGR